MTGSNTGSGLLADRVAVITGGTSGIGRGIALAFAEQGARAVIVAARSEEPREGGVPTHRLIAERHGIEARFVPCEITDSAQIRALGEVAEELGGADVWVNNAGIVGRKAPTVDYPEEDFDEIVAVNIKGTWLGSREAARQMIPRGDGRIINIASVAGVLGSHSSPMYSATKAAVRLFTKAFAREIGASGVRANCILPGSVQTTLIDKDGTLAESEKGRRIAAVTPLGRIAMPADIANAAVFLASDLSDYVTGTDITVDGGLISQVPH
jgi:NAD(P)-dependent dehydrogenase (short-subunit alcohol dehydrogenase family)